MAPTDKRRSLEEGAVVIGAAEGNGMKLGGDDGKGIFVGVIVGDGDGMSEGGELKVGSSEGAKEGCGDEEGAGDRTWRISAG